MDSSTKSLPIRKRPKQNHKTDHRIMTKKEKEGTHCSFCGRPEDAVEKLISGPDSYICDKCVRLCMEIVEKKPEHHELKLLKPQEIKIALDEYEIGRAHV